jgi:membrane protease YdiL (CAAX protease family)
MGREVPSAFAVACAGLSAFGPTLAALAVAGPRGELGQVFRRWRTSPGLVPVSLLAPAAIHLAATLLYVAIGGRPERWFHPPEASEQMAALVVFPLGEEFGWRGFAHPRMVRRHGPIKGSLMIGAVWGLWHLMYGITPEATGFDFVEFGLTMAELPLYSLIMAWVFERSNRSMLVAILFHASPPRSHRASLALGLPAARAASRGRGRHRLVGSPIARDATRAGPRTATTAIIAMTAGFRARPERPGGASEHPAERAWSAGEALR